MTAAEPSDVLVPGSSKNNPLLGPLPLGGLTAVTSLGSAAPGLAKHPQPQAYQQTYQEQQVLTASPQQLLLMLYDGAIRFLKIGRKAQLAGDTEKSHQNLVRAQKIIAEFMGSLDLELGGEAAQNLLQLYEYLHHQLVQANLKKEIALIDEVLGHLSELRKTWAQAIAIANQENQAENAANSQASLDSEEGLRG